MARTKLPFSPDNQNSADDAVAHLIASLNDYSSRYDVGPFVLEAALNLLNAGHFDTAMGLSSRFEDSGAVARGLGVFAAALVDAGHAAEAKQLLARAESASEAVASIPASWAPAQSWIQVARFLLDGDAPDFALMHEQLGSFDVKPAAELATLYAAVGSFDKAFAVIDEFGEAGTPGWGPIAHLTDLVLERNLDQCEAYIELLAKVGWVGEPELLDALASKLLEVGEPARLAALLSHFSAYIKLDAETRLAAHLSETQGVHAAVAQLTALGDAAQQAGDFEDEARLLAVMAEHDPDVARERLVNLLERCDFDELGGWAREPYLAALALALPRAGAPELFGELLGPDNTGDHWVTFLRALPASHPLFAASFERALASAKRWNWAELIEAVGDDEARLDLVFETLTEQAGNDADDIGTLAAAAVGLGDFERAQKLQMSVPKKKRPEATAQCVRRAAEIPHWSAYMAWVETLPSGLGSDYREYESLRAALWSVWNTRPRIAMIS